MDIIILYKTYIFILTFAPVKNIDKFERILSEIKESKKQKNINYLLGYSNFTFELWLILHKQNCNGPLTKRQDYITQINKCFCNSGE